MQLKSGRGRIGKFIQQSLYFSKTYTDWHGLISQTGPACAEMRNEHLPRRPKIECLSSA